MYGAEIIIPTVNKRLIAKLTWKIEEYVISFVFFCCINPDVKPTSTKTSEILTNTNDIPITPKSSGSKSLARMIDITKPATCLTKDPLRSQRTPLFVFLLMSLLKIDYYIGSSLITENTLSFKVIYTTIP